MLGAARRAVKNKQLATARYRNGKILIRYGEDEDEIIVTDEKQIPKEESNHSNSIQSATQSQSNKKVQQSNGVNRNVMETSKKPQKKGGKQNTMHEYAHRNLRSEQFASSVN